MKTIYEILYKNLEKIHFNKTTLYKEVEKELHYLKDNHINYTFKSDLDVFLAEVAIQGVKNKEVFDITYNHFLAENFDLLSHINYEQRRKLCEPEIREAITNLPYFIHRKKPIYIPYLEDFVNERYVVDYELLTLKKHEQYLNTFKKDIQNSISLYGPVVFSSDFSSLTLLDTIDHKYYFYHPEFRVIYILEEDGTFFNELILCDKKYKEPITVEQAKEALNVFINKDYISFVNYLEEKEYVPEKITKKIIKKIEKVM